MRTGPSQRGLAKERTMFNGHFMRPLSAVLVLMVSTSPVVADASSAMMHAKGAVLQNGSRVGRLSAVFYGDQLQTGQDSAAAITTARSSILVPARSSLIYGEKGIELLCGGAVIATDGGLSARVNNLAIRPISASAKYEVVQSLENLQVITREGALSITDEQHTLTLAAGESIEARGGCTGASIQRVASPMPQGRMDNPFWDDGTAITLLMLGITAAVITAIIIAVEDEEEVSPTTP